MNKEQIIDKAYENYCMSYKDGHEFYEDETVKRSFTKEEFINKCKTDSEFSEKWGLKIEERELSDEERYNWYIKTYNKNLTRSSNQFDMNEILNSNNIPTKLITITYKNEKIESYD